MERLGKGQEEAAIAAREAGITVPMLRNWMHRKQIYLDALHYKRKRRHARFTLLDVARLQLIGRLVKYGVLPESASDLVEEMIAHATEIIEQARATAYDPKAVEARADLVRQGLKPEIGWAAIWLEKGSGRRAVYGWKYCRIIRSADDAIHTGEQEFPEKEMILLNVRKSLEPWMASLTARESE